MTEAIATPDEVSAQLAVSAHQGTSFVPERRGKQRQQDYADQINADYAEFCKLARTPEERAIVDEEFQRYKAGYLQRYSAYLSASSRVVSFMITGPSRFPVERNRKRNATADRRYSELREYRDRALAAIRRRLRPDENGIRSADPKAVEKIGSKVEELRALQERMKATNALIRKYTTVGQQQEDRTYPVTFKNITREELTAKLMEMGYSDKQAYELLKPDFLGRIGYPDYALKNNNANIRRYEQRSKSVEKMQTSEHKEEEYGDATVIENPEEGRIQISFPGKPSADTIASLKSHGFRWSPRQAVWQRHLNYNGRDAVDRFLKATGRKQEEPKADPLANYSGQFQQDVRELSEKCGKSVEAIVDMWREYGRDCRNFDQSALWSEFLEWYKHKLYTPDN